jgi:sec-independent protein translocase protein TatC
MKDIDDTKAPLLEHLIELRRRLLWSVLALLVAFGGCVYFARRILAFLVAPLLTAGQDKIINTEVFGGFVVELKVAFFAALMLAFPVIANQIWQFVAPGLYPAGEEGFVPLPARHPRAVHRGRGDGLLCRRSGGLALPARLSG